MAAEDPKPNDAEQQSLTVQRSFVDVQVDDRTELIEPRSAQPQNSSRVLHWADLLRSRGVLIISPAGSGKTYECKQQVSRLVLNDRIAFFVELAELSTNELDDLFSPEELLMLKRWRASQSEVAVFFLDSVDELKLTKGSFKTAINRLRRSIDGQLARARFVVTSRPVEFERELVWGLLSNPVRNEDRPTADEFADQAMGNVTRKHTETQTHEWRTVRLLPLSERQVSLIASQNGVRNPSVLIDALKNHNAMEFAERPQDLLEICSEWQTSGGLSSYRSSVENAIQVQLRPRTDRNERAELSNDRAVEGASRLALAAILTRRLTFRHGPAADVDAIPGSSLNPMQVLPDWPVADQLTLLERAAFGFANYGRVRFHHRSVLEYLAAKRLRHYIDLGLPVSRVKRLLFTETYNGDKVVKPAMRAVAAWLALESESIFAGVLERDPTVMLNFGDPDALANVQKVRALRAYIKSFGHGGWRGLHVPHVQVRRFGSPGLAPLIRELWTEIENSEVRLLLIELIAVAGMSTCSDLVLEAALATDEIDGIRLSALSALLDLRDSGVSSVAQDLLQRPSGWPNDTALAAAIMLFPESLSVTGLLTTFANFKSKLRAGSNLSYLLPQKISTLCAVADLDDIIEGLSAYVKETVDLTPEWHRYGKSESPLLPALAAACSRRLSVASFAPSLTEAINLVVRAARQHDNGTLQPVGELRSRIARLDAASRSDLFWKEDEFRERASPEMNPAVRFFRQAQNGPISFDADKDSLWVWQALNDEKRTFTERAIMVYVLLSTSFYREDTREEHIRLLRSKVSSNSELKAVAEKLLAIPVLTEEISDIEASLKSEAKKAHLQASEARESWKKFHDELVLNSQLGFSPERWEATVWNLWQVTNQLQPDGIASGWDRKFLEKHFGSDVSNKMSTALSLIWRRELPTLWSERKVEKRNTYFVIWQVGLGGIVAESEHEGWATRLSKEEAKLACRYAPIQLNGLPSWLDELASVYPEQVLEVLGAELIAQLSDVATCTEGGLLSRIRHASTVIVSLFSDLLLEWLAKDTDVFENSIESKAAVSQLILILGTILQHVGAVTALRLREIAVQRLTAGLVTEASSVWAAALLRVDPEAGLTWLEAALSGLSPTKTGPTVSLFAILVGAHNSQGSILTGDLNFKPNVLLRLLILSYQHVRREDDSEHEGAYIPGVRDQAQDARRVLLESLLRSKGVAGWKAKLELADNPLFSDMRDRILSLAREQAADEADDQVTTPDELLDLERFSWTPPATSVQMFTVMEDRLDDLDDFLLQDGSPREFWSNIHDERTIRGVISARLRETAHGAYTLDQESVTAEEKETDIRFRSTLSLQEGVIEIKVGEKNRSAMDLRRALSDQLVRKYLAPSTRRAGMLLITVATDRLWLHPETKKSIDITGLIKWLNEAAYQIMVDSDFTLRISARAVDLRPRLGVERPSARRARACDEAP